MQVYLTPLHFIKNIFNINTEIIVHIHYCNFVTLGKFFVFKILKKIFRFNTAKDIYNKSELL